MNNLLKFEKRDYFLEDKGPNQPSLCVDGVLVAVDNILLNKDFTLLKTLFESRGLNSYYDFYYDLKLKDFKNILKSDQILVDLYEKISGEKISKTSKPGMLNFCQKIGFKRNTFTEIKDMIVGELENNHIKYLNEFSKFGLRNFKKIFSSNNYFKYFCEKIFKDSLSDLTASEYEELGEKLGLKLLDENGVLFILKNRFLAKGIYYLDDLNDFTVRSFIKIVGEDLLLKSYFENMGIFKSFITLKDINNFGKSIGLEDKTIEKKNSIKNFLRENHILTFIDLENFQRTGVRSELWSNTLTRTVLEGFGLEYLQDFRYEHILRFARYVGIDGIPNNHEYNENTAKVLLRKRLSNNGINCIYSLQLLGRNGFVKNLRKKTIGEDYTFINKMLIDNFGSEIGNTSFDDLEQIGKLIGLPLLTEEEHKIKLIQSLLVNGDNLDGINRESIRNGNKYWSNPHMRYFLENSGGPTTDLKDLRSFHIKNMLDYINNI